MFACIARCIKNVLVLSNLGRFIPEIKWRAVVASIIHADILAV